MKNEAGGNGRMVKLKVSYENMAELAKVMVLLGGAAKSVKLSPEQKGKYKRAYVDLIDLEKAEIIREGD